MAHKNSHTIVALLLLFTAFLLPTVKADDAIYTLQGETLIIKEGVTELTRDDILEARDYTKVHLPSSLREIKSKTFYYCTSLRSINLPSSLVKIGDSAFFYCEQLEHINVPVTLYKIGVDAFAGCEKINKLIYYDDGSRCYGWVGNGSRCPKKIVIPRGVVAIDDRAFCRPCEVERVVLPEGLISIGSCAFPYTLRDINIPKSVEYIGDNAINIMESFGCTKVDKKSKLLLYANGTKCYGWVGSHDDCPENLVIPEGVTYINKEAFSYNNVIKKIVFPESLRNINDQVCGQCFDLETVVLSKKLKTIGQRAFSSCENLKNVNVPSKCEIKEGAFELCKFLNFILLTDNDTVCIGCTNREDTGRVVIPKGVKIITDNAFKDCKMREVNLPDGLEYIGSAAFESCTAIEEIVMPNTVCRIGNYSIFGLCTQLRKVRLSNSLSSIPPRMFSGCRNLETIEIPNSVKEIGSYAFNSCVNLKSVILPDSIDRIESHTFDGCSSLEYVKWPSSLKYIDDYAFNDCSHINNKIPKQVRVANNAFGLGKKSSAAKNPELEKLENVFAVIFALAILIAGVCVLHKEKKYSWGKSIVVIVLVVSGIIILSLFCFAMIFICVWGNYHG